MTDLHHPLPTTAQTLAGIACVAAIVIGVAAFALWLAGSAFAHEAPTGWRYPYACCSDRDCNMIDADRVREGPDGYEVTLLPGDHDFVKDSPVSYLIPYERTKDSPDGAFHICISPSLKLICFFAGARMF